MSQSVVTVSWRQWVSLAALCAAAGLVWLAAADLPVATPAIADEFNIDLKSLEWANNIFPLVTGALVIAAGKFGDIFGQRRMVVLGVVLFCVFSVVASCAGIGANVGILIAGRALMGVGAALILPATLALIPAQFSGRAQLTAFGTWMLVAWGGQAFAPALSGIFVTYLGWQWLFWINVPLGVAIYFVIRALTPEARDERASRRIEWLSVAVLGLAVFTLLYALTEGPSLGWGSPIILALLLTVALFIAWFFIERAARDPLVNLTLFRARSYTGAVTANFSMNLAFAGLSFLLVLWLENVREFDAIQAGFLLLPATLGIFLFIPLGNRFDARGQGRLAVLAGLLLMSLGLFLLALWLDASLWLLGLALMIMGVGLGLLSTPISNAAVGTVPLKLSGTAAGVLKMSSMVGGALGVAVLSALAHGFTGQYANRALEEAGFSSSQASSVAASLVDSAYLPDTIAALPGDVQETVTNIAIPALTDGVVLTITFAGVLSVIATVVVALLWRKPAKRKNRTRKT